MSPSVFVLNREIYGLLCVETSRYGYTKKIYQISLYVFDIILVCGCCRVFWWLLYKQHFSFRFENYINHVNHEIGIHLLYPLYCDNMQIIFYNYQVLADHL